MADDSDFVMSDGGGDESDFEPDAGSVTSEDLVRRLV